MEDRRYFENQAARCRRLAALQSDSETVSRLRSLAVEFDAKAREGGSAPQRPAIPHEPAMDDALEALAVDGDVVILCGATTLGVSLTPRAARETAARIAEAAAYAERAQATDKRLN